MKRLLLLRHAKAAPLGAGDDYERELTQGGEHDAIRLADYVASRGLLPDLILYSGAWRTRGTVRVLLGRWRREIDAVEDNQLYDASWRMIVMLLQDLPEMARSALIVGHNPGVCDAASQLAGLGENAVRFRMASQYPTSGLAVIDFKVAAWHEIAARSGRLDRFVTPADLGES